jgi:hypothetical protein
MINTNSIRGFEMSHKEKANMLIIKRATLLCGLLFAAVVALLPISARAQCANWDASVNIALIQPGSKPMELYLIQNGKRVTGNAGAIVQNSSGHGEHRMAGIVDGSLDGDSFSVQIYWDNGQTGVYQGKVLLSGRLDGEAWEKSSPNVRLPWHTDGLLGCPQPPKPPPPPPIKSSGKARSEPPAPTPPPPTPPFITAGQAIIPTPTHPFGIVPLSWDGGPDHPNVEVWLSMDNGAEIPAFSMNFAQQSPLWKQPKAGGEMQLQRYHHYRFVLRDAGKTLSTAAFVVP